MSRWSRTERILALLSAMVFVCAASASGLHAVQRFERGDSNADERFDISDAMNTLGYLFLGTPASLPCPDAADSNDDGTVDISDASHALGYLFLGTTAPPAPFGDCGEDSTADTLGCEGFAPCPAPSGQMRISGLLQLPDGTAAAGARIRTTLGGEAIAGANGAFALEVEGAVGAIFSVFITYEAGGRRFSKSVRIEVREGVDSLDLGAIGLVDVSVDIFIRWPLDRYDAGCSPGSVASGDLDGDADADLAVADWVCGTVSVLRNQGDGRFEAAVQYGGGNMSNSIALGDLDGDGDADLAMTNEEPGGCAGTVSMFRNKGDGTFEADVKYAVGECPLFVSVGDLDGDRDADLAVANGGATMRGAETISVLRNHGDGTFEAHVQYGVGGRPLSVALGDLDGDGDADLAVANLGSETVSVLRNHGDGTFEAHVQYGVGSSPHSVALGDLDGDGDADLAVANGSLGTVSVLWNQGGGTFEAHVQYGVGNGPVSVAMGDFDRDGNADLAVATIGSGVSVLRNHGDGTFEAHVQYAVGGESVALGDFDRDGDADLAVAGFGVAVVRNHGDGTFEAHVVYEVGVTSFSFSVAQGDLDGDGDADLAVANFASETVSILQNRGDGTFEAHVQYGVGGLSISVALGDLDGDGDADLAVAHDYSRDSSPPGVSILRNQGDGTFEMYVEYTVGGDPRSVALGDLDGDGDADLAVAHGDTANDSDPPEASIPGVSVLRNQGDGTFEAYVEYSVGNPTSVVLGDLDGDGDADIAVMSVGLANNTVSVLRNRGDGTFEAHVEHSAAGWGNGGASLALGDLDGDRDADIAVANGSKAAVVSVLRNQGDGTFEAQVEYLGGYDPHSVALGDLDGDGDADLVDSGVSVLRNHGDGTFEAHVQYAVGGLSVALGDFDRDGDADLAVAGYPSTVTILFNQTVR